jgi:hypothetical protein
VHDRLGGRGDLGMAVVLVNLLDPWSIPIRAGTARIEFAVPKHVKYVGDAACARCHPDVAQAYRNHPMGRSLKPIDQVTLPETGSPSFCAQGLEYSVERRGDHVFHHEIKRDSSGAVVSQNQAEARFVIGSGEQALAFLLERGDGHLFESPITWYSRKKKWDLSPGYEKDNLHFERFIKPACLFCHSNRFDHVPGTENQYRQPIFI